MDHKDLDVWKKSMDLVASIYKLTLNIPDSEKFGLISQMRRSVISIPSNIAEGAARKGDKELIQFIHIALGSLSELETQYLITLRLGFVKVNVEVEELLVTVKKLLLGFKKYLAKNKLIMTNYHQIFDAHLSSLTKNDSL
ncbi:four helix bundle protein [Polaribacter sejongensis]|uniref:four helix bundle protein n=1 Tax=Polaribacter sejongensis TaxID=985043 RepID=UPI0035A70FA0